MPREARIGRVLRATGLAGEVRIELFRPRRDPQPEGALILEHKDGSRLFDWLVRGRFVDAIHLVAKLKTIDDREHAEALAGAAVIADLDQNDSALVDGADRLLFLDAVEAASGRLLGTIADIQDNGAQALLAIAPAGGGEEKLVPFVPAFVEGIELREGRVCVPIRTIPGLFEEPDEGP